MNRIERLIIRRVFKEAREAGFKPLYVFDGEEIAVDSRAPEFNWMAPLELRNRMINYLDQLDDGFIYFTRPDVPRKRQWVYFVFGNGNNGADVITDYTLDDPSNFHAAIQRASVYAEHYGA